MASRKSTVTFQLSGTTGSADTREQIQGLVDGIYYDADPAAPSTADITVAEKNAPAQTILSKLNVNTDQWFYPRKLLVSGVDGSALSGPVDFYLVNDFLTCSIAQGTTGQWYTFTILWDDAK